MDPLVAADSLIEATVRAHASRQVAAAVASTLFRLLFNGPGASANLVDEDQIHILAASVQNQRAMSEALGAPCYPLTKRYVLITPRSQSTCTMSIDKPVW
jgi:hypothetical protein